MQSGTEEEGLKRQEKSQNRGAKAEWQQLKQALEEFRRSAQASAERPEAFWESQRRSVRARPPLRPEVRRPQRLIWVWASATVVLALGVVLVVERQQPVSPDFAAGYDQQLLLDVEQALDRDLPAPLEPAALLPEEISPRVRIIAEP